MHNEDSKATPPPGSAHIHLVQVARSGTHDDSPASRPIFVTCSHVIAPWRYPKHFQEPWLRFVNESHIRCTIEIPQAGLHGGVLGTFAAAPPFHFDESRDICAFRLKEEDSPSTMLPPPLLLEDRNNEDEEVVLVVGLPLGEKPEVPKLRVVMGKSTSSRDQDGRHYAIMSERLSLGMSGAPVVGQEGHCRGLFQGILGPPQESAMDPGLEPLKADWERCAGYIPAHHLQRFLSGVLQEQRSQQRRIDSSVRK